MARKFFSCCFVALFVPLFLITIFIFNLRGTLFNPNFYKNALRQANFYSQVLEKGIPSFFDYVAKEGGKVAFGPLSKDDLNKIFKESVSPSWLQSQTENIVDGLFNYFSGKTSSPEIIIPLGEIKKSLSDSISRTTGEKWNTLPNCTNAQIKELESEGFLGLSMSCKPPGTNLNQAIGEMISGKESPIGLIPEQYDLGQYLIKSSSIDSIKTFYSVLEILFWVLLIATILFFVLLALINIGYFPGMLKWISIPMIVVSALVFIFALINKFIFSNLFGNLFFGGLPKEISVIIQELFKASFGFAYAKLILYSGISLLVFVILLILAIILSKKYPKKEPVKV